MTLREYVHLLRDNKVVVIVCLLVGLCGAGIGTALMPRQYQAELALYVSAQPIPGADAEALYQSGDLAEQRMKSYERLVTSPRVIEEVVQQLQLDITPEELTEQITATAVLDTVVLDIVVVDSTADRAALIANTTAESFVRLVEQLERPADAAQPALVTARIVRPASPPATASTPMSALNVTLGGLLGLLVGLGAAVLRHSLDQSVRSAELLRRMLGVPTLGVLTRSSGMMKRPLVILADPKSSQAEEFRQLRTTLQFNAIYRQNRVIVLSSALPDEGKTVTACNLAIALADAGSRVLLVDADLRDPKVTTRLGLERADGLREVLDGTVSLPDAVRTWGESPFDVLGSGDLPFNPSELLGSAKMAALLGEARRRYDAVLIDTPPLLPFTDAAAVAPYADGAILLVRYGRTRRDQVKAAAVALEAVSARLLGSVITVAPSTRRDVYPAYSDQPREPRATAMPEQFAPPPPRWRPPSPDRAPVVGDRNGRPPSPQPRVEAADHVPHIGAPNSIS